MEAALPPSVQALLIQDREADIFPFFAAPRRPDLHLLIRATEPRRIEVEPPTEPLVQPQSVHARTLFEAAAAAPALVCKSVAVQARPGRKARTAHLTLRLVQVSICPPRDTLAPKPAAVPMWVVRACEEDPLPGVTDPILWVLLTTLPEVDAAKALDLVDYYALRWRIERFHYVLKSGCGYEKLQCDTLDALNKALSLYSIVAWRLLWMTYLARDAPDTPASDVLSWDEQEVLTLRFDKPLATARDALLAVAKLGGFVFVPSAPHPGVKCLWLGFRRLQDLAEGYKLAQRDFLKRQDLKHKSHSSRR